MAVTYELESPDWAYAVDGVLIDPTVVASVEGVVPREARTPTVLSRGPVVVPHKLSNRSFCQVQLT